MLVKEKRDHHKELLEELEEVKLGEKYKRESQSPYLVDYLYGVSDIDQEVNKYLEDNTDIKWTVFYRCILKDEYLSKNKNSIEYDKFRKIGENLFLIRDEEDFEDWKNYVEVDKKDKKKETAANANSELRSILEETVKYFSEKKKDIEISEIDDLFLDKEVQRKFLGLLKKYLEFKGKNNEEAEKCIFRIDELLKEASGNNQTQIDKTSFFTDVLKINKAKISKIKNKFSSEVI